MGSDDTPRGTPYDGPMGIARDSVWLTNEDLPHDKDTPVTIECVNRRDNVKWKGGRKSPIVLSLKFVGKTRELRLNAGHRKVLTALFGSSEGRAIRGKSILLYVEQDVQRPDGTTGPAVRIRAKRVDQTQPPAPAANPIADDLPEPGSDG